jgi:hypothetical protein
MRTIVAAIIITGGIGLIGSSLLAAPISGAALDPAARATSPLAQARYVRWHGRTCYVKCYYDFLVWHRVCRRFC